MIRSMCLLAAVVLTAGCGSGGATAPTAAPTRSVSPTAASAIATAAATAAATDVGSTRFTSTAFDVGFSITLPAGWKIGVEDAGMFTAYLLTSGDVPDVGVDLQMVPAVHKDPCDPNSGTFQQGFSPADLAAWMLAFKPLAGTAGAPTTIGGSPALVIDEAFAGTPCPNPILWSTPGGWVYEREQKRYFIFEAAGRRFVATIFSTDEQFASHVDVATAVLASIGFLK